MDTKKSKLLSILIHKIYKKDIGWNAYAWDIKHYSGIGGENSYTTKLSKLTNEQVLEYYLNNQTTFDYVYEFCKQYKSILSGKIPISLFVFAFYNLHKIDVVVAEEFFGKLATGEKLTVNNPIYHLREKLIGLLNSKTQKIPPFQYEILFNKAWNAYRKGEKMYKLYVSINETKIPKPI